MAVLHTAEATGAASSASAICFAIGKGFIDRNGAGGDALRQILALDQFHQERRQVRCLLEPVDRPDVRMVEGREDFGFALKAREAIRIAND